MSSRITPILYRLNLTKKVWDHVINVEFLSEINKFQYFFPWLIKLYFTHIRHLVIYYTFYVISSLLIFDVFILNLRHFFKKKAKVWSFKWALTRVLKKRKKKRRRIKRNSRIAKLLRIRFRKKAGLHFRFFKILYA